MMPYILAALMAVALSLLILGAVTGQVKMSTCCSVADPSKDLRMRAAYEGDGTAEPTTPTFGGANSERS